MVRYLDNNTKKLLSRDETEILLFALYLESQGNPNGLVQKAVAQMKGSMVFVFGSNEAGIHGAGAAKVAAQRYGAVRGVGEGHEGNSYALPTRTGKFVTLDLPKIQVYVNNFIKYAKSRQDLQFQVTAIGTGHAGLEHADMAPMFAAAPNNCQFDSVWQTWLPDKKFWGTYDTSPHSRVTEG